ncbi:hypothetical protein CSV67_03800 [Sporosarcina sp. P2]|uniref:hypothetical protein n=1 Tax=Sporosarcina sp. P2 TaxID=2048251 RepID=UPI000C1728D7|nr:hypothetical protein [Sporosarcina sp. P2]PID03774.1 hypothetical protein CSV67_03800 [Sporosarcina sp. P2]
MGTLYEKFSDKEVPDKIVFMEDWITERDNIEHISERELKRFFRKVLENENNAYIKTLTIEALVFLTIINKVRRGSTLDMLLDIENEEDPFVLITSLRYLTMFFDDQGVSEKLESCIEHQNPEVSSEAYYRLGLLKFLECNTSDDKAEFIDMLNRSSTLFNYARTQIENRTDADYFYNVSKFIESFFTTNEKEMDDSFEIIFNLLSVRSAYHYNQNLLAIEYKLNKVFYNLKSIYESTNNHNLWIDFFIEFKKLSEYHYELLNVSLSGSGFQQTLLSRLQSQVNENILKKLYFKNFSYYEIRINTIISSYSDDKSLSNFLSYLLEIIKKEEKKKDDDSIIEACVKIDSVTRGGNVAELVKRFKTTHDIQDLDHVLEVIAEYTMASHGSNYEFITGFQIGEEIFNSLYSSIKKEVPNYSSEKLHIFMQIMEQIIRYLILTVRNKRDEVFNFLYTEKHKGKGATASEKDLQDSLFKHFQYSGIAYGSSEEEINFADGGRIDIVYKINNYTFPIELKKTKQKITEASIRDKYLEQVHSYVYSYDQLGVFVLLDLNEKDKPVNDLRELVYLDHIEPLYELKNTYPDNIVVVIIPGNKPLPSDKSTYR